MRRFIKNSILFAFGISVLFVLFFSLSNTYISRGDYFSIPKDIKSVILGHSHSACAFNDSLIDGFYNLSQNTEGYPYSYFKLKKILESNDHLDNVFVEFTNNQMSAWARNRVSGLYLDVNMPRSFPVMDASFVLSTFGENKNPKRILNALIQGNKSNADFLLSGDDNYIRYVWKTHETPSREYKELGIDTNDPALEPIVEAGQKENRPVKGANLEYLLKLIQLCEERNVNLYLVRSPMPASTVIANEKNFHALLETGDFRDIAFLDFKKYPLPNRMFADKQHLNSKGQDLFSYFFNHLMATDILEQKDIQLVIDTEMERQKQVNTREIH